MKELPQCMLCCQPNIKVDSIIIRASSLNDNDIRQRMRTQLSLSASRINMCVLVLTVVHFKRPFDEQVCVETQYGNGYDQDQT